MMSQTAVHPKGGSTMEPRHEEKKNMERRTEAKEAKPRRFRIVKLEERIAPCNPHVGQLPNTCRPKQCW
jgi:hypothetical protein